MPTYTAAQAAVKLGLSATQVKHLCRQHGIGTRHGPRMWILTGADLERLRRRRTTPGPAPRKSEVKTGRQTP